MMIEFAKIGLGTACVIREFVREELSAGTLIEIPLARPIPRREVGFAYTRSQKQSKVFIIWMFIAPNQ